MSGTAAVGRYASAMATAQALVNKHGAGGPMDIANDDICRWAAVHAAGCMAFLDQQGVPQAPRAPGKGNSTSDIAHELRKHVYAYLERNPE
jgi:hypothetical protein